jgi:hypothetical protein
MRIFAMLLMQRLLGLRQFSRQVLSGQVHASADAFRADRARASRAIS